MRKIILGVCCISLLSLTVGSYGAVPGNVVINEIMYNTPGDDEEWVEIYNNSYDPIILDSTWLLTDGEGVYHFEGISLGVGEYLTIKVYTNDSFPFTPDIDAVEAGIQLSNTSDQVVIRQDDLVIDSVEYHDWWGDMAHDGTGPSLERRHPFAAPDDPAEWNSSTVEGGTPGAENSIYASYGDEWPVVYGMKRSVARPTSSDEIHVRVIAYDDLGLMNVELLYNTGEPPWTSMEMADDGAHEDREANDNIYGASIPAMLHGTAVYYFVRAIDSDSKEDSTELDNYLVNDSLAYGSQVVINEIMYNSIYTDTEYVELYNREEDDIDISGWEIKDATDNRFTFPEGTILGGFEYLVVCKDTLEIIGGYGISNVIGNVPYTLNNGDDKVLLFDEVGFLMDSVMYYDGGDWPTEPDGNGPSLELIDPFLDNTLPSSWAASEVMGGTPGIENTVGIEESGIPFKPENLEIVVYPNPFNSVCKIAFVGALHATTLEIIDINGRLVRGLERSSVGAFDNPGSPGSRITGSPVYTWNPENIPTGIYFIKASNREKTAVRKVLYLR